MILSPLELELLVKNSNLGERMRKALGVALHTAIFIPECEYEEERFNALNNEEAFDVPDDEMLLLCADYLLIYTCGMLLDVEL